MSQMLTMAQVRPYPRVVSARTAQDLGNKIPGSVLLRAGKVIE